MASRGLFATGVSTDLSMTYLSSGGKIGDTLRAEVSCDKCESKLSVRMDRVSIDLTCSWQDNGLYFDQIHEREGRAGC